MLEQTTLNSSDIGKQSLTGRQMQFVKYFEFFSEVTMVHPTCESKKMVKKIAIRIKNHPLLTGSNQDEFTCNEETLNGQSPLQKQQRSLQQSCILLVCHL